MAATTHRVRVDPSNAEQARAWDGDEGTCWAANAERFDAAVEAHHHPFLEAAAIGATDQVLDIGCGTGRTTRDAASAATSGAALGLDLSSQMIEVARRLAVAEGLTKCPFRAGRRADLSLRGRDVRSGHLAHRCHVLR
jgi:cyclopropane fatty-acyl-phospholipid synthase-like methyltransferase